MAAIEEQQAHLAEISHPKLWAVPSSIDSGSWSPARELQKVTSRISRQEEWAGVFDKEYRGFKGQIAFVAIRLNQVLKFMPIGVSDYSWIKGRKQHNPEIEVVGGSLLRCGLGISIQQRLLKSLAMIWTALIRPALDFTQIHRKIRSFKNTRVILLL